MSRQEGHQMLGYAYGAYTGSASAVGRGKGLVEVQVTDIGADGTRVGESHLCVHVGTVHVDLCSAGVYDAADFLDFGLEDACVEG